MYDVVVIGGGPGGYAAALYAHNFGLSVAMVEMDAVGGTCLVRGCIPAKAWLQTAHVYSMVERAAEFGVTAGEPKLDWGAALARKNTIVANVVKGLSGLLTARKVEVVKGFGKVTADGDVEVTGDEGVRVLETRNIILATGSYPRTIPGWEIDGQRVVSSTEALDWMERPERVAVIGGGVIGCEFASLLSETGSQVWIFEALDQILPGTEESAVKILLRRYRKAGVTVTTGVPVGPPEFRDGGIVVTAGDTSAEVDVVLMSVGRGPLTDGIGLEHTQVKLDGGYVLVDAQTQLTDHPGIYAVGDIVAGTPQLAHAGYAEAIAAITHLATGETAPVDYRAIPSVVYTHPEIASVGLTEQAAHDAGYEVEVTEHGMRGLGRAQILGEADGIVRVVAEQGGPTLGATVVAPNAGDLIHELMYVVAWEALPTEAAFVHAHPTLAEAIGETLLAAAGRPLH
jgi:dihydrolipoamide dehydrogenase